MESEGLKLEKILNMLSAAGNPWEAGLMNVSLLLPFKQKRRLGFAPAMGEATIEEADQRRRLREIAEKAKTSN